MMVVVGIFLGLVAGSFLNVCILRLPKKESIVLPASHCMACQVPLTWYENIPVFSFLFLKGRCRHCLEHISWQYPAVEALAAILFVIFLRTYGLTPQGVFYLLMTLALFVVAVIDARHKIIPDEISLGGLAVGILASTVFPSLQAESNFIFGLLKSLLGALVGGGVLYCAGSLVGRFLKKEAMGGGDVKLGGMIGAFLGFPGALWTVFVSSLIGSVVGFYLRSKSADEQIPYGPFLAVAAVSYLFFGQKLMMGYWSIVSGGS